MNDFAKQWIVALRSGKYKQGRGYLRNGADEFCCLGVACDVAEFPNKLLTTSDFTHYEYDGGWFGELPPAVRDQLGLRHGAGRPRTIGGMTLVHLNDDVKYTFAQIADHLEANEAEYFVA